MHFYEAGITMNGQIVLCKGINDGAELDFSIRELTKYYPCLQSVSVVPVGLSKYREGLYPLEPFTKEETSLLRSLTGMSNNLNQLAHEAHIYHFSQMEERVRHLANDIDELLIRISER